MGIVGELRGEQVSDGYDECTREMSRWVLTTMNVPERWVMYAMFEAECRASDDLTSGRSTFYHWICNMEIARVKINEMR